jgi:SAM-dependent methyltransferase
MMDRRLNIRTVASPDRYKNDNLASRFGDPIRYVATDYGLIRKCLAPLDVRHDDVVFDVGCGMGRVLCYAARWPVRRCIGIELNTELAAIAVANAATVRHRKAEIEIRQQDAAEADYSEGTIFWLYHPFGEQTLRAVLDRIYASLERAPRSVRIFYARPVHEHLFQSRPWLVRERQVKSPLHPSTPVSYWRNR